MKINTMSSLRTKDLLFHNCKIVHGKQNLSISPANCGYIHVDSSSGKIKDICIGSNIAQLKKSYQHLVERKDEIDIIDCQGHILSPGFIDIQINGAHGVDFSSPSLTKEDVIKVSKILPQYGVTSFCPTIISSCNELYTRNIPLLSQLLCCHDDNSNDKVKRDDNDDHHDQAGRSKILGLHLEGPFFAHSKKGAHNGLFIKEEVNMTLLSNVYSLSSSSSSSSSNSKDKNNNNTNNIKIITMAPELPGALSTIQSLTNQGVVVSMGHTDATLSEGMEGVKHGATLITHLFNAMKSFHHREPGLLGLIQSEVDNHNNCKMENKTSSSSLNSYNSPFFSIIVDGLHSHPSSVKMAYTLNPTKLILVTDAMSAMGLGNGTHHLGSMTVSINDNKATLVKTNTLAGSVVSMDTCVKNLKMFTGCRVSDALAAATLNPARLLGYENDIGTFCVGSSADLILLDDDLNVIKTWIRGKLVYDNSSSMTYTTTTCKYEMANPRKRKCN